MASFVNNNIQTNQPVLGLEIIDKFLTSPTTSNTNFNGASVISPMGNNLNLISGSAISDSDTVFLINENEEEDFSLEENLTDFENHCHISKPDDDKLARNQLIIVSFVCFIFIIAELIGGIYASSLALATDATHLACDLAGFLVSLFAMWISKKAPTQKLSFGYYRAEIVGALCSILLIWVLTVVLVIMAGKRIKDNDYDVEGLPMVITAFLGVCFNIVMMIVLHSGLFKCCQNLRSSFGHGHSHGNRGHSHDHHHHDCNESNAISNHDNYNYNNCDNSTTSTIAFSPTNHDTTTLEPLTNNPIFENSANINVRAAFVHVVGDLIQSVGVFVAALIIIIKPSYKIADPICTFVFSFLVLCTTLPVLRDILIVIMEGVPNNINYKLVAEVLAGIEGVKSVHSLNIWSITIDKVALNVHLAIADQSKGQIVLNKSLNILRSKFKIFHPTVQIEVYDPNHMTNCSQCLLP